MYFLRRVFHPDLIAAASLWGGQLRASICAPFESQGGFSRSAVRIIEAFRNTTSQPHGWRRTLGSLKAALCRPPRLWHVLVIAAGFAVSRATRSTQATGLLSPSPSPPRQPQRLLSAEWDHLRLQFVDCGGGLSARKGDRQFLRALFCTMMAMHEAGLLSLEAQQFIKEHLYVCQRAGGERLLCVWWCGAEKTLGESFCLSKDFTDRVAIHAHRHTVGFGLAKLAIMSCPEHDPLSGDVGRVGLDLLDALGGSCA